MTVKREIIPNNNERNLRSRIGGISELKNIVDGIDIEGQKEIKTTLIEVSQNATRKNKVSEKEDNNFEIRKALIHSLDLQYERLMQSNEKIKKLKDTLFITEI